MKVLKYSEMQLMWIGLGSLDRNESRTKFLKSPKFYFFLFGIGWAFFGASAGYVYSHADHLANVINSLLLVFASFALFGSYVNFGFKMNSVKRSVLF